MSRLGTLRCDRHLGLYGDDERRPVVGIDASYRSGGGSVGEGWGAGDGVVSARPRDTVVPLFCVSLFVAAIALAPSDRLAWYPSHFVRWVREEVLGSRRAWSWREEVAGFRTLGR